MLDNLREKAYSRLLNTAGRFLLPFTPEQFPIAFIWGAPYSGSYITYDLLSLSPQIACPRKYNYKRRNERGLYRKKSSGVDEFVTLDALGISKKRTPIEGYKHIWKRENPREEYRKLLGEHFLVRGGTVLDKAPHYALLFRETISMFPHARHISCIRDPRCLVLGYIRAVEDLLASGEGNYHRENKGFWHFQPKGWEAYADRTIQDKSAWAVLASLEQQLENEKQGEHLRVHYERLVADVYGVTKNALQFLGNKPYQELRLLPKTLPNFNERRLRAWPDFRTACDRTLVNRVEELTRKLGYEI